MTDSVTTDPNFSGSIFEQLGYSAELCSRCLAHLYTDGICLNGCHLSRATLERFNKLMKEASEVVQKRRPGGEGK